MIHQNSSQKYFPCHLQYKVEVSDDDGVDVALLLDTVIPMIDEDLMF